MMARPALVIFIEYALIGTSLVSIFRAGPAGRREPNADPRPPLLVAIG